MAKQKPKSKRDFLEAYDELCQVLSRRGQKNIMAELERYRAAWKKLKDALGKKQPSIDEVTKLWNTLERSGIQSIDKLTELLDSTNSTRSISVSSSSSSSSKDKSGSSSSSCSSDSDSDLVYSVSSSTQRKQNTDKAITVPINKAQSPVSAKRTSKRGSSSSSSSQSEVSESGSEADSGSECSEGGSDKDIEQPGQGSKGKATARRAGTLSPTKESKAESISAALRERRHANSSSSESSPSSDSDSDDSEADAKAVSAVVRTVPNSVANPSSTVSSGLNAKKRMPSASASESDLGSSSATETTNEGPVLLPSNATSKPKSPSSISASPPPNADASSSDSSDSSSSDAESSSSSSSDTEKEKEGANAKGQHKQNSGSNSDSGSESASDLSSDSGEERAPPAKRQKIGYGKAALSVATNEGSSKKEDTPSTIDGPQSSYSSVTPSSNTAEPTPTSDELSRNGKRKKQPRKNNTPFQRVKADIVTFADKRLENNSFTARGAKPGDYGERAHKDLIVTRGAGFRKEKNKKKRGSYHGGEITLESHSIKFT